MMEKYGTLPRQRDRASSLTTTIGVPACTAGRRSRKLVNILMLPLFKNILAEGILPFSGPHP